MAISTTTNRVSYQGDGTSAVFAFQYEFHAQADLNVYIWNSARLVATSTKVLNTDYTISGTQDAQNRYRSGANVIFNSTPAATDYIVIVRDTAPSQPFNLLYNQTIPSAELVKSIDRIALLEQRLKDLIGRTPHLSDSYPLTFSSGQIDDRLQANAPLIVNSSAQGFGLGVVAFNGSTAASYFGILPVPNGGTGVDFSALQGLIYSPGSNTTFQALNNGTTGQLLTSNGSSAPTFQSFSAAGINSGIFSVSIGGTGTGTGYVQYALIYASSATQMASTGVGGVDQPLIGNAGAAPSFQRLNLASGSSVKNILAQVNGGTGTASSFPQYGVIYQQDTNVYGFVPSAADGRVLTAHGSSAPSFDVSVPSPVAATTLSSTTILTTANKFVLLNSSGYNVYLYNATGQDGREIEFIKNTAVPVTAPIVINGTSAQLFSANSSSSFPLYTSLEYVKMRAEGGQWFVVARKTRLGPVPFQSVATGTWIKGLTADPAYGTQVQNYGNWWRSETDGRFIEYEWFYRSTTAGSSGTGLYVLDVKAMNPNFIIDPVLHPYNSSGVIANFADSIVGQYNNMWPLNVGGGFVSAYGSTYLKVFFAQWVSANVSSIGAWGSTFEDFATSPTMHQYIKGRFAVTGWPQ